MQSEVLFFHSLGARWSQTGRYPYSLYINSLLALLLDTILFLFGWLRDWSTYRSAAVGNPGLTTVTRLSSGMFVSWWEKKTHRNWVDLHDYFRYHYTAFLKYMFSLQSLCLGKDAIQITVQKLHTLNQDIRGRNSEIKMQKNHYYIFYIY